MTLILSEAREAAALRPVGSEIGRIEPALEGGPQRRPLAVDDREPGGVAVVPFDHLSLAEEALVAEAVALGGGARRRIEGIAFPLVAAVAQFVEDAAHHQIHRLGAGRPALQ